MKIFWYFYIVCVLGLGIGRTIERVMIDQGGIQSRYWPTVGAVAISIGVLGYVLRRRCIHRTLWMIVTFLIFLGMAGLTVLEVLQLSAWSVPVHIHGLVIVGIVVLAPASIALYRYSFKSPEIWTSNGSAAA